MMPAPFVSSSGANSIWERVLALWKSMCGGTQRTAIALLKMETEGIWDGVEHAR